jgi:hypothetical protein
MTPLVSALAATSWLGLVTLYFWRRRVLQVAADKALALLPRIRSTLSGRAPAPARSLTARPDEERPVGAETWIPGEYSVVREQDTIEKTAGSGLSHAQAMLLAESLRGPGLVVTVMHVIGRKSYEVDRYPAR